ncbi:MAG: hypothetical protein IKV85_06245 [Ruminococcus sp.]|nr:hypothetical protein [Ruminococcus sp.]
MKRKILSLFLCSVMLTGSVCGCESKNESINDNSVNTEATVMPNEVKAKVKEAAFMESVSIPENGWTDETLLDTVRINGEKVEFPFCLNDLGNGFVPIKDEWQYIKDGEGKSNVEYYQNNFCMITTYNTSDLNNIANDEIRKFQIWIDDDDIIKGDYPICINGVTIGSDYDEIHEKLGFEPSETGNPDSNTKGIFTVRGYTDNYRVMIQGANLKVKHISILNQK